MITKERSLEERVQDLEWGVSTLSKSCCVGVGGSLSERVALLERAVAALELRSSVNVAWCAVAPDEDSNTCYVPSRHTNTHKNIHEERPTPSDLTLMLSKIVNPKTNRPYSQSYNEKGFRFGDRVYSHNYKKWENEWEDKPGYVVGHSFKMVWIAEEPITLGRCVVYQKTNRNVFRR
jgi:hypothetical protein